MNEFQHAQSSFVLSVRDKYEGLRLIVFGFMTRELVVILVVLEFKWTGPFTAIGNGDGRGIVLLL